MAFTDVDFRRALSHFATGVTVVTTVLDNKFYGLTVSAFCSVSLHPPLVLVSIDHKSQTFPVLRASRVFGVNVLSAAQQHLSERFARKEESGDGKSFSDIKLRVGETGAPLFEETLMQVECRVANEYEGGDHTLFLGEVIGLHYNDTSGGPEAPLLYFYSRYCSTQDRDAGKLQGADHSQDAGGAGAQASGART